MQGQVGWDLDQPGLVEGVPAHARGWDKMEFVFPSSPKPFCDAATFNSCPYETPHIEQNQKLFPPPELTAVDEPLIYFFFQCIFNANLVPAITENTLP